mmetsp:Transcript_14160/g.26523  ORF Transcript_14160/g.26523 Transcript_14160/m.26523 type:complete len:218 (+) Transcript_14160:62-715(+)
MSCLRRTCSTLGARPQTTSATAARNHVRSLDASCRGRSFSEARNIEFRLRREQQVSWLRGEIVSRSWPVFVAGSDTADSWLGSARRMSPSRLVRCSSVVVADPHAPRAQRAADDHDVRSQGAEDRFSSRERRQRGQFRCLSSHWWRQLRWKTEGQLKRLQGNLVLLPGSTASQQMEHSPASSPFLRFNDTGPGGLSATSCWELAASWCGTMEMFIAT